MEWLLKIGIGVVVVVAGFLLYDIATSRDPRADLHAGVQSVKHLVSPSAAPADAAAATPDTAPKPSAPAPSKKAGTKASPVGSLPATPPVVASSPVSIPKSGRAMLAAPAEHVPTPARSASSTTHYVAGNVNRWTPSDVVVDAPTVIRAGGSISTGSDTAGPAGMVKSNYERMLISSATRRNARVLDSAPYLSLIGRLCSQDECSPPFPVGAGTVVCPATVKMSGQLQLWTNNYIRVGGGQTVTNYSVVTGGFSVTTEPAPANACEADARRFVGTLPSLPTDPNETVHRPEFVVTSSQTSWKPIFLPMDAPLLIRASGDMRPRESAQATGPDGIPVSGSSWSYPGSHTTAVDAEHPLFEPSMPYQALIGRMCGAESCGKPFLVGHERTVCPSSPYADHLELWINLVTSPPGLLGSQTPLTMQTLDLQTRLGAYSFVVSRGDAGQCASAADPGTR